MEKTSSLPGPLRSMSIGQRLLLVIVGLVIAFLILGTVTQSEGGNGLNIGIQTQPFLVLAFLSFGGGLLSFVSPCTLPVLTAYFAFAFQSGRSQIAANTLAFMLGLATTFSLLGAVGFALGRVLLGNQQIILLVGGAFIIVFGVMSLLGMGFTEWDDAAVHLHAGAGAAADCGFYVLWPDEPQESVLADFTRQGLGMGHAHDGGRSGLGLSYLAYFGGGG